MLLNLRSKALWLAAGAIILIAVLLGAAPFALAWLFAKALVPIGAFTDCVARLLMTAAGFLADRAEAQKPNPAKERADG